MPFFFFFLANCSHKKVYFFPSTDIFTVKRRLRDYRREMGQRNTVTIEPGLRGRSGRVVITAIVMYVRLRHISYSKISDFRFFPYRFSFLFFSFLSFSEMQ